MHNVQPETPRAAVAGDRYRVRVRHGERHGYVSEVAGGYVWVVYNGDNYAVPYSPHTWDAMVAEGRAVFVGSVVPG